MPGEKPEAPKTNTSGTAGEGKEHEQPRMGPLAVLVNPLAPAKDKFLVFSSSPQRTLTVEHRRLDGTTAFTISPEPEEKFDEFLAYPSSLAALLLEETICVFGIIGNEGHYKLALVSPAPQTAHQLEPTTTSLAGFSVPSKTGAPGGEAYLYFQSVEKNVPCIREWLFRLSNFTKPSAAPIDNTIPNFLPGTKLAAATDSRGNRWLAYQAKDTTICVYNAKTRANERIEKTTSLVSATVAPFLGVTVAPADKTTGRPARVYVYFVGSDSRVHVVSGEVNERDQSLSFAVHTNPVATFDVHAGENAVVEVPSWSQLAVVPYATRTGIQDPDAPEPKMVPKPCNLLFSFDGDEIRQTECDEWN